MYKVFVGIRYHTRKSIDNLCVRIRCVAASTCRRASRRAVSSGATMASMAGRQHVRPQLVADMPVAKIVTFAIDICVPLSNTMRRPWIELQLMAKGRQLSTKVRYVVHVFCSADPKFPPLNCFLYLTALVQETNARRSSCFVPVCSFFELVLLNLPCSFVKFEFENSTQS